MDSAKSKGRAKAKVSKEDRTQMDMPYGFLPYRKREEQQTSPEWVETV